MLSDGFVIEALARIGLPVDEGSVVVLPGSNGVEVRILGEDRRLYIDATGNVFAMPSACATAESFELLVPPGQNRDRFRIGVADDA